MILTHRFASPRTAAEYPLECSEQLPWQADKTVHHARIELPEIPAATIIVPSLALLSNDDYRFQFTLRRGTSRWALHTVPSESAPEPANDPAVSTHIDCFHVHQALSGAELEIELVGLRALSEYLVTLTARELELDDVLDILTDKQQPADDALPDRGKDIEMERRIAPCFIVGDEYGTRASTVLIHHGDRAVMTEQQFEPGGVAGGRSHFTVSFIPQQV